MKFLIQRVTSAQVEIDKEVVGKIKKGFLILVGIGKDDTYEVADRFIKKVISMRIFADENGKTNLNIKDVNGSILLVSQFTLYAECYKGNRPTFNNACEPNFAKKLYEYVVSEFKKEILCVESGVFGADMQVTLTNDGPFTIMLE